MNPDVSTLSGEVIAALREMQGATHALDRSAAEYIGVNGTDLTILGALERGPRGPHELATIAQITPASCSVAIRRLEASGLIVRELDPHDGRRAVVRLTPRAVSRLHAVYGPLQQAGNEILGRLTARQLNELLQFLRAATDMQTQQTARIRALHGDAG